MRGAARGASTTSALPILTTRSPGRGRRGGGSFDAGSRPRRPECGPRLGWRRRPGSAGAQGGWTSIEKAAVSPETATRTIAVGKPSPIILEVALAAVAVRAAEAVIVGDRLETDIAMGKRLGVRTILVLTGVTRAGDPRIAADAPDHVLRSIEELIEG